MASEIDVLQWIVVGIFVVGFAISVCLVASVQGDLLVDDARRGADDNAEATDVLLSLIDSADRKIIIHDDGNCSPESVCNNPDVLDALRQRIAEHGIEVKCLFNDADPNLGVLDLAREFTDKVFVWHLEGERPGRDIHYIIVDDGKLVHLSEHAHGSDERDYVLRKANQRWAPWLSPGTRSRISKPYMDHFHRGVAAGKPAQISAA